ncbi:hypothetical protein [Pedococcus soli]
MLVAGAAGAAGGGLVAGVDDQPQLNPGNERDLVELVEDVGGHQADVVDEQVAHGSVDQVGQGAQQVGFADGAWGGDADDADGVEEVLAQGWDEAPSSVGARVHPGGVVMVGGVGAKGADEVAHLLGRAENGNRAG